MSLDPVRNFAYGVLISGISDTDTSLTVSDSDASKFPDPNIDGAFNVVIYNYTDYKNPAEDPDVEIVRVTNAQSSGGNITYTITRAQEGTTAKNHNTTGKTYRIILAPTKKMIDDIGQIYVPYTGATQDVDLGAHNLTVDTNTFFVDSVNHRVGILTTSPGAPFQLGATNITGNVRWVNTGGNPYFGIYNSATGLYYGISAQVPSPSGASTLGGYFKGLGIGGIVAGTGDPIFGVLNSQQSGHGIGDIAFTIYANNKVVTYNNTLDAGDGGANFAGNVGIGTTSPAYKLDVSGNLRAQISITAGINVESLSGNKTLTPGTDKMYQYLNPNGANRTITLSTTNARAGDKFVIRNNAAYNISYRLQINQGATTIDYIYSQSVREYIFDGTNWIAGIGTGISSDLNVAIGYYAVGYTYGTAVGYSASGRDYGVAVGGFAVGANNGVAVGYSASGYTYGVAIGRGAVGYTNGVAVGSNATGNDYGVAIGYGATGNNYGVVVGVSASGYDHGAALGYSAFGYTYGVAIGYLASAFNYGVAVGYSSAGYYGGVALGYGTAGYSSGVAVGWGASGYNYGVAVGYYSKGVSYGTAVGYYTGYNIDTSADRYNVFVGAYSGYGSEGNFIGSQNVFVGAYSGYQISSGTGNIILGYQAGYDSNYSPTSGSYNILIGYNAWTPYPTTSNFLNIGGLIFGTYLSTGANMVSTGNVGIRTPYPTSTLHIQGVTGYNQFRLETSYTPTGTSDGAGEIGDIAWDNDYLYVKTSDGWKRSALSTW